jgi:hypothetical protein
LAVEEQRLPFVLGVDILFWATTTYPPPVPTFTDPFRLSK